MSSTYHTDFHHLPQFLKISSDEVEEREFVEVLGPLVRHLHHLVITLQQGGLSEVLPAIFVV